MFWPIGKWDETYVEENAVLIDGQTNLAQTLKGYPIATMRRVYLKRILWKVKSYSKFLRKRLIENLIFVQSNFSRN